MYTDPRYTMAPAGSSSLLRARRRDATLKPNRVLDKSSSRGMIYENEELRLRTININAEVERSQSDVKKLRRENELLRREIWGLRDECDRLEELLERQQDEDEDQDDEEDEQDEDESSGSSGKDEEGEEGSEKKDGDAAEKRKRKTGVLGVMVERLSVVPEEAEETSREPTPQTSDNPERQCEEYMGTLPPLLRINCIHPYTAAATLDPTILPGLTVGEVIESCWQWVGGRLEGVRLLGGCVYLAVKDQSALDTLLPLGLPLRGHSLPLEDVSRGTVVIAMSGVPHTLPDTALAKVLAQFGPLIGYIERRFYRNVDTGERLARLRPVNSLPRRLYVDGQEVALRTLPHDELARLATLPSTIVRDPTQ